VLVTSRDKAVPIKLGMLKPVINPLLA